MLGRFQRLGPWLFCLFLVAQIGGVMPLVYVDVVHEYGDVDATRSPRPLKPIGRSRINTIPGSMTSTISAAPCITD